ncbi:hypothetical protein [Mycolicibacterium sp. PDY-3]|uniref:hypothetical protein n=1 Tax=Mycolicibacterium sp. PDY-3 TaxID=3376069 RepID=UPI003798F997
MDGAVFQWAEAVSSSSHHAKAVAHNIADLRHQLDDVVHAIDDLGTFRFDEGTEEYEILEKARGLSDLVERGIAKVGSEIVDVMKELQDLRRAVEFYRP